MKKLLNLLSGVFIALAVTFILELIFAFIVKTFSLSAAVIRPVNQVIKAGSVVIGALFGVKEKGALFGAGTGLLYGATANLIMYLIGGGFSAGRFFLDILFCVIVGVLSGLIAVNLKKR